VLNKLKNLKSNQEFMKYFNNTSWLFVDKIFKMGVGFFVIIYLTRYLGPERFGILSYSQSFVSIFTAFASLGLGQIVIRELIKYPEKQNILLGTFFYLTFSASILSIVIIFGINYFIDDDTSKLLIYIISFSVIFQNLNLIIDNYFQYKVLSKYIVYCSTIGFISSSSVKIILIYFEADLIYFAYALLFDSIVLSILFLYIYTKQNLSLIKWKFDKNIANEFLKVAWPLVLVAVSAFIYTRIDQIMIKHMIGDAAAGNYAAAIRVSELFYFIPGIIVGSLYPKLIELKKIDEKKYLLLLEKMYKMVVWIAIPIALGIFIYSDLIVNILYGSQYKTASEILSILSWGIIFASISAVFVKILYIEHYEKKYLYKSLFGVCINIILNYILIQKYGVNGAAIATILTMFCINYIYDILDNDIRKFYYLKFKCFIPKFK
jgi:O-antigen/teichoic acid export membrane protein